MGFDVAWSFDLQTSHHTDQLDALNIKLLITLSSKIDDSDQETSTMSSNMDFTDLFRSGTHQQPKKQPLRDCTVRLTNEIPGTVASPLSTALKDRDLVQYVIRRLQAESTDQKSHSTPVQHEDISGAAASIINNLIDEKCRWKERCTKLVDDICLVQQKCADLEQRYDTEKTAATSAQHDIHLLQNRISAMKLEQREVKRVWLSEKNDLQNRVFQVQALHTQIQGTLKKRERDFEKLQNSMAKAMTRDGARGSGKHQTILLSAPLKRSGTNGLPANCFNSSTAAISLLKDIEISSMRCTMQELERENFELRNSLRETQERLIKMKDTSAAAFQQQEFKLLRQHNTMNRQEVQKHAPQKEVDTSGETEHISGVDCNVPLLRTPGKLKRYQEDTPGARKVHWTITPGNSEVRKLRERAESISSLINCKDVSTSSAISKCCTQDEAGDKSVDGPDVTMLQMKVNSLRQRLDKAVEIIEEQDTLIHEALVGRPSLFRLHNHSDAQEVDSIERQSDNQELVVAKDQHAEAPVTVSYADLLPAATPDTWQILQGLGFQSIRRETDELKLQECATVTAPPTATKLEFDL